MPSHLSFENPPVLAHEIVVETLERALRDRSYEAEAAALLIGSALNDDDEDFVEHWCVQVGTLDLVLAAILRNPRSAMGTQDRFTWVSCSMAIKAFEEVLFPGVDVEVGDVWSSPDELVVAVESTGRPGRCPD